MGIDMMNIVFSGEFLEGVQGTEVKNLAAKLLERIIIDKVKLIPRSQV